MADACHACTESFQSGMYFLLAVVILLAVGVAALLALYLVRHFDRNVLSLSANDPLHGTFICDGIKAQITRQAVFLHIRYVELFRATSKSNRIGNEALRPWHSWSTVETRALPISHLVRMRKHDITVPNVVFHQSQVGGKVAVSSQMTATRKSVESLHRRGSSIFTSSEHRKARSDFRDLETSSVVSGTGGTTTVSLPSGVESRAAAVRSGKSGGSGEGAVGEGAGGRKKGGASAGRWRLGTFLTAIPLSKLKIVIGNEVNVAKEKGREEAGTRLYILPHFT